MSTVGEVTIYHNPRCSKSRQTLALLEDRGIKPNVVEYLETPPTASDLDAILNMLGLEPRELMRTKEDAYQENNLAAETHTRADLIQAMINTPILIERPIVVHDGRAVVGRPPENIEQLF